MSLKHKYALYLPKVVCESRGKNHSLTEFHVGLSNIFSFAGRIKRGETFCTFMCHNFPLYLKKEMQGQKN